MSGTDVTKLRVPWTAKLSDRDGSWGVAVNMHTCVSRVAVNTHVHADHITGSGLIGQRVPGCKSVLAIAANMAKADRFVKDEEAIEFGSSKVVCRSTPGHTDGGYWVHNMSPYQD